MGLGGFGGFGLAQVLFLVALVGLRCLGGFNLCKLVLFDLGGVGPVSVGLCWFGRLAWPRSVYVVRGSTAWVGLSGLCGQRLFR